MGLYELYPLLIPRLSTELLRIKYILLINVKMPTIVGLLTFISMIYTTYESLKVRKVFIYQHLNFNEQFRFHAQIR